MKQAAGLWSEEVRMAKRVSTAQAKAQFSALVDAVATKGEHYVIERRGKPVAALVSVQELTQLEGKHELAPPREGETAPSRAGALGLVGAWGDLMTNEEIDEMIAHIYETRERDLGRPVNLED
jgi:prevent-host-death family protein